ncbi:UNVERIFIED_CONTAM: hypothetical protein PYX00_009805 [Menopon gallinae]|uniref:Uncharacterized protein n=1 Tax=Menopon gallinae TaxID=328185 RepID=A0AAW2HD64_9NEOP
MVKHSRIGHRKSYQDGRHLTCDGGHPPNEKAAAKFTTTSKEQNTRSIHDQQHKRRLTTRRSEAILEVRFGQILYSRDGSIRAIKQTRFRYRKCYQDDRHLTCDGGHPP